MIKIADFMVKDVITISCELSIYDAVGSMVKNSIGCLVVVDNKKPIGFVTEQSIIKNVLLKEKNPKKTKILEAMDDINLMRPNQDFFDLVEFMRKNNVKRVVIVEKGNLVGIVTETDVVRTSIRLNEKLEGEGKKIQKKQLLIEKLKDVQKGVRKMDSGYEELNHILKGGFPYNKSIVLEGPPGSGKGLIAFNFMKKGMESKNKVAYICMNEIANDIKELFASIGLDLSKYSDNFRLIDLYSEVIEDPQRIYGEDDKLLVKDFSSIKKSLLDFIKTSSAPIRCVVNVISQSSVMYNSKVVYKFTLMLNDLLKKNGATTLYFIHKANDNNEHIVSIEEIMDGVLDFSIKREEHSLNKILTIKKMKPEFAILPQFFSYDFDKNKNFSVKRELSELDPAGE